MDIYLVSLLPPRVQKVSHCGYSLLNIASYLTQNFSFGKPYLTKFWIIGNNIKGKKNCTFFLVASEWGWIWDKLWCGHAPFFVLWMFCGRLITVVYWGHLIVKWNNMQGWYFNGLKFFVLPTILLSIHATCDSYCILFHGTRQWRSWWKSSNYVSMCFIVTGIVNCSGLTTRNYTCGWKHFEKFE